jgi:hypothetical protein
MAASKVIDLVRAKFANLKKFSEALSGVDHKVLRGRFREILIEELLASYLPSTVELLTGTILGANGEVRTARNEDDVVIFDNTWAPLLLRSRGRDAIMPITGVRAHIEVKSNVTVDDIRGAIAAADELSRMAIKVAPIGLLFAFDTTIGTSHHIPDLLMKAVNDLGSVPIKNGSTCPIQGVCIMGRGSWYLQPGSPDNKGSGWYKVEANEDRELLAFISIRSNSIFGNERGLGTHVLDLAWLNGPNPAMPNVHS